MASSITGDGSVFDPSAAFSVLVPDDGDALNVASIVDDGTTPKTGFWACANAIDGLRLFISADSIFGGGTDGAAVFDGSGAVTGCSRSGSTYTATRDLFYTNATFSAGVTLKMGGYRLYVNGTLTMSAAGCIISCDGVAGSGRTAGGVAGVLLSSTGAGGDGGASGGANNGTAGSSITSALGAAGGAGGNGAGAGAAAGTATTAASTPTDGSIYVVQSLTSGLIFGVSGVKVVQGGSGGGGGGAGTGAGGGGGGGGGVLLICARLINLGGTSSISAVGGSGAAGSGGANAGGGGGGGGGAVVFVYRGKVTGNDPSSQISVAGGAGGTGTSGGSSGTAGTTGASYVVQVH